MVLAMAELAYVFYFALILKYKKTTQQLYSLVYPDPYKKGLGNKARSSVHIGMC